MKLRATMKVLAELLIILGVSTMASYAQNDCFKVHVTLNAQSLEQPESLIFKTSQWTETASLQSGCFKVPQAVFDVQSVDLIFTVLKNHIHLSSIPTAFFVGSWDVLLADKRFERVVVLPKHARVQRVCAVVFHVGEPETFSAFDQCRTAF